MIQQISQQISLSIKIQDIPEQNLELKQYPIMGGNLEFEQE